MIFRLLRRLKLVPTGGIWNKNCEVNEKMEKSIGQILKETREKQKIKLEDVRKKTKIIMKYLLALEEDRPGDFPGEAYFLSFLRSYAKFLGLDGEELVQKYRQIHPVSGEPVEFVGKSIRFQQSPQYRLALLSVLFIVILIYFLFSKLHFKKKEEILPLSQSVVTPEEEKIVLEAKATADTWLRVIADGSLVYERILFSGMEKRWEAKEKFHLRVGYVPGLEVKLNGQPVDLITGSRGYVKELDLRR